jgi:EAL domain-containing protein (putative c-di-GMP-specific phosphodiesterase class I)
LDGPLSVLRIAERHRRLGDIGERVLALAAGWLDRIPGEQRLFINLSAEQLADPVSLREHLQPVRPQAHRVTLEITEQSHLRAIDRWEESVALIRDQGFAIAVDDLGAGYNSLAMLADLQPAYVKLDMSLVRDVHLHDQRRRIVELITSVATAIQARVIAEGVENISEANALRECGCHLLQGYHFGRPVLELPRGTSVVAA